MKKLQEKIMRASFGKLLKRWVIAALCVTLLGGGVSAALLSPQIRETITAVQTIHQQKDQWEHDFPGDGHDREEENRERFEAEDVFRASITRPSTAAFIERHRPALRPAGFVLLAVGGGVALSGGGAVRHERAAVGRTGTVRKCIRRCSVRHCPQLFEKEMSRLQALAG